MAVKEEIEEATLGEPEEEIEEEVVEETPEDAPEGTPEEEKPEEVVDHAKLISDLKEDMKKSVGALRESFALNREASSARSRKVETFELFPGMPDDYMPSKAELAIAFKNYEKFLEAKPVRMAETDINQTMTREYPDFREVIGYLKEIIDDPKVMEAAGLDHYSSGKEIIEELQALEAVDPLKAARYAYRLGRFSPKYKAAPAAKETTQSIVDTLSKNTNRTATLASAPARKTQAKSAWDMTDEEFEKSFNAGRNK